MDTFRQIFESNRGNRSALLSLLDDIDSEKRKLRQRLKDISSGTSNGKVVLRGNDRIATIEQYKRIIDDLVSLREEIKVNLGNMKQVHKTLNRIETSVTIDYKAAFMVAADELLSEDQLNKLELRAEEICSFKN